MIRPGKLFWKLFLGNILLIAAVLLISSWLIFDHLAHSYADQITRRLLSDAATLRLMLADKFDREHAAELDHLVKDLAKQNPDPFRVTLILPHGEVLADSWADPTQMESHAGREEVKEALAKGWGTNAHFSHTLSRPMYYAAIRLGSAEAPNGVIRVAVPQEDYEHQKEAVRQMLWTIAAVSFVVVIVLALGLTFIWTRPIQRITAAARSISDGDLSARVPVGGRDELALLAQALNRMRNHLAGQLQTIDRQRRTLQSLIAQLQEGVVVAGPDGRVVLINPTALRLLGMANGDARAVDGRAVEELIAPYELQRMLLQGGRTPSESGMQEFRLQITVEGGDISVLARASDIILPSFAEAGGELEPKVGRLLVLTDVTALDRMLQVKADFAANASHELRTPLATIRAAVETLMQIPHPQSEGEAASFLRLIDRHSKRMEEMVADLLNLSRIESSPTQFQPARLHIRELMADVQRRHAEKIENKGLQWSVDMPTGVSYLVVNPHLFHLVLDNVLDNAIKFTERGGHIRIKCWEDRAGNQKSFHIQVADTGCGIPEEDQARVFERFYQVERARSGADRGTGLGLSIVRHAVAAMHGTVELISNLGKGTSVTVNIPQDV